MTRTLTALSIVLGLTACATPAEDYASILPDDRLLVDLPADFGGSARSAVGESSEYYALTAEVTTDINTLVGDVLTGIDFVTDFDPTWTDGRRRALWGPWEDGDVNGRLWVEEQQDGSYTWALEAKAVADGEDAWGAIVAGEVDAGSDDVTSSGRFGLDFGAIAPLDPNDVADGEFYVEYAVDGDVVDAEAVFVGIVGTDGTTGDAAYVYGDDGTGNGFMDLAVLTQAVEGPDPELHLVRSRWNPDGEGRADVYLTEGDLGALVYNVTECWAADASVVFYEENYSFERSGDDADCAFGEPEFNDTEEVAAR